MGDRFRARSVRGRPFSTRSHYPESLLDGPDAGGQHDGRSYFGNDAGMNDRPLQFNGNPSMSGNPGSSHDMMDVYQPRILGMPGMPNAPLMGHMAVQEVIHGNGYIMYPNDGTTSTPVPSERPVGCKTVIFSEVPFEFTGDMLADLCERVAGSVDTLDRSNGPFCQVRFHDQGAIDRIFAVHGMLVCVGNNESRAFSGRLLVDYLQNPKDLREYESEQRRVMRELRHEEADAEVVVVEFTRPFIDEVTESMKGDTITAACISTLLAWLERGNLTKKTASVLFRLVTLTNSHVKRLQNEKIQIEDRFDQARQYYIASKGSIVIQLTLIEQVFTSASKKKVWDHFTKAQRKSLDQWSEAVKDLRSREEREIRPEEEGEADMEIASEDEDAARGYPPRRKRSWRPPVVSNEVTEIIDLSDEEEITETTANTELETEDKSLEKKQVESTETEESPAKKVRVYETESSEVILEETAAVDRSEEEDAGGAEEPSQDEIHADETGVDDDEITELREEDKDISESEMENENVAARKTISELRRENKDVKTQLETFKKEEASMKEKETQIKALQLAFVNMQQQLREAKSKLKNDGETRRARELEVASNTAAAAADVQEKTTESSPGVSSRSCPEMSRNEGALLSFICVFLHAHPFGASIDYLYSYLSRLHPNIAHSDIDNILQRYPNCFLEELSGVGASIERRWKFVAFEHALKKS